MAVKTLVERMQDLVDRALEERRIATRRVRTSGGSYRKTKTKRSSSADKSAARKRYRAHKAQILRSRRKQRKTSQWKRRQAQLARVK